MTALACRRRRLLNAARRADDAARVMAWGVTGWETYADWQRAKARAHRLRKEAEAL